MRLIKKYNKLFNNRDRRIVVLLILMMIVSAMLEVCGVGLMVPLMTAITDPECITNNAIIAMVCGILGITSHHDFVLACVLAFIALYIFKDLFITFETRIRYKFIFNRRYETQNEIYEAYMNRPYEFFLNSSDGEVLRIINEDTGRAYTMLIALMSLISESIVALALVITVFIVSPLMTTLVALAMGITSIVIIKVIRPKMSVVGETARNRNADFNEWVMQSLGGMKEIKVSNTTDFFRRGFDVVGKEYIDAFRKNAVWSMIPRLIIEMVSVTAALSVVAFLIFRGQSVEDLIPAISAFALAAIKILPSANRIVVALNEVAFSEPALDNTIREVEVLSKAADAKPAINVSTGASRLSRPADKVELKDITYMYPNSDKKILDNANMEIPIGKSIGIVGASGAGKTTAVDVLLGLLTPKSGQVLCDGRNVFEDYAGWLSNIAYIPQTIFLTDDTIRANVAFGIDADKVDEAKVWNALKKAQLEDFVKTQPGGLMNRIGERGVRLSGGQRQRIGVARALYNDPEILVFDEATSALDNDTEAAIMESINALHGEKTLIIIAHRLTTIENCDMVYRVENGKIIRER